MAEEIAPTLIVTTSQGTKEFTLTEETLTIGRDPSNDIVISDQIISRKHAKLQRMPDGYKIADLGSTNGLTFESARISEKVLVDGDTLWITEAVSLKYEAKVEVFEPLAVSEKTASKTSAAVESPSFTEAAGPAKDVVPQAKPWFRRRSIMVGGGAIIVAAIIGAVLIFIPMGSSTYPSDDQLTVLNARGQPPLWSLIDGPISTPDGKIEIHRVELWDYPNINIQFSFVDGTLIDWKDLSSNPPPTREMMTDVAPSSLGRDMTLAQVQLSLGEKGERTEQLESKEFPNRKVYRFNKSRLIITFLDGNLFIAQSYIKGG